MNKLINMTDFVLNCDGNKESIAAENEYFATVVTNYANFLKQELTLGMFVPVDEKGNVITEPPAANVTGDNVEWQIAYNEAKSKVLFKGLHMVGFGFEWGSKVVELELIDNDMWINFLDNEASLSYRGMEDISIKTVEDLLKESVFDLTLTDHAKSLIF